LIIALDNSGSADEIFNNKQIAINIIKKANEFFRIGGCLDELRISVFQFDGKTVQTVVNLGDNRRFMFDRMSCMENSEENANKLIKAVERMEPLESTESSNISLAIHAAMKHFTQQTNARKGSVQRRLMRWGFDTRKALVLVTGSDHADMGELGKEAKDAGIEIIAASRNMDINDSLSVLATESLRLEKFSPFILDATSPDTPWLISAYLKNSQEVHKYATPKWSPPTQAPKAPITEDYPDVNLDDFDLVLKQNCKLNPCCCEKAKKIAQELARRREESKSA